MAKTILVADDSRTIRRAVELTFRATDFKVVAVDSADQALRSIAEIQPDLVLADASMPGTDGYALCNAIKTNAQSSRIPVLLLASKFDPFDEGRGREARADGHVDKPWDTQTLINLVKSKIGVPLDNGVPQSFAATLAQRAPEKAAAPANGQPPPSPFGAPLPERAPSRPPSKPPALPRMPEPAAVPAAPVRSSHVTRGAGMGGSLDDVFIEEPVDGPAGPSLEPPPAPRPPDRPPPPRASSSPRPSRPKVDLWALDEQVRRTPDAGPPPGSDDAIEEIAIDDVPNDHPTIPPAPVAKLAAAAAPAIAKAAQPLVPGVPDEQMLQVAREVVERIAWEVVPELAETIIRAELQRLLADED